MQQRPVPEYGRVLVVYDHTGTRAVSADGSASNCTDPDDNTDVSLGGTATGTISFTETGVDEDTGEPFTNSGSLGLGADAVSSDVFSFANASGSDSFRCALNGTVGIEQVQ